MLERSVVSIALTGLCVVVLVGCTKDAVGEKPTPAMLSDALPTITDMPGTWAETQRQIFDTRANENPSIDPSVWCDDASEVTKNLVDLAGVSGADVEMQLADNREGARMMRLQAWSNDDVESYFGDAAEAARICDGKTFTDADGVGRSWKVIEGRDIGDESISWMDTTLPPAETQKDKFASVGRTTVARFGDIVMVMQLGDANFTGATEPMPEDEWWSIVEIAGQRLNDLDNQVHD